MAETKLYGIHIFLTHTFLFATPSLKQTSSEQWWLSGGYR